MRWLTTTPITQVERGNTEYDETALREGVRNFVKQFGDQKPLVINLGNEPHGTGDKVLRNVTAYKIVYDEIKKLDPTIPVVATSVEPNEDYFKAGYGQACDAFDFHIYEDSANVRRTINEYRALQKKYDCVKPIWSNVVPVSRKVALAPAHRHCPSRMIAAVPAPLTLHDRRLLENARLE